MAKLRRGKRVSNPNGVISLTRPHVDKNVVEHAEEFLKDAKSGKLEAIVSIGVERGRTGGVYNGSAGNWSASMVFYAIECWKHRQLHGQQEGL